MPGRRPLPPGWALDAAGRESRDGGAVVAGIEAGARGGILPLGGWGETQGGQGLRPALMVDLARPSCRGADQPAHEAGRRRTHLPLFLGHGLRHLWGTRLPSGRPRRSSWELRQSAKADGQPRIYTHGEKAWASRAEKRMKGIPVQEKTWEEIQTMAEALGLPLQ